MTLSEAVEIIEKSQEDITDRIFTGEKPYPPDEYFIAVEKVLPYLKCLNCLTHWASMSIDTYLPRCGAEPNFRPIPQQDTDKFIPPELNADELPFG